MKLKSYLKDKFLFILIYFFLFFLILLLLLAFKSPYALIISILGILFFLIVFFLIFDFYRKKVFYDFLLQNLDRLDKKYLITEIVMDSPFYEGKLWLELLYEINKSMLEELKTYKMSMDSVKEYMEMWIHEVKLPLQALTLTYHNHKNSLSKNMVSQIQRIDDYLEQILYYIRIENAEHDYLIKECNLGTTIHQVALRNKNLLLESKIQLFVSDVDLLVLTDSKWLEFILNQIINNSIKYHDSKKSSYIKIMAQEEKNKVILTIYDNGIGIDQADLPRVFEKTFTGKNGRVGKNSTGMGLYIANQLCKNLGYKISIKSKNKQFTMVTITFFKDHHFTVLK